MIHNINKAPNGFTLIEMLITVTILLILAAVAVPNYRQHVVRSQRSDAMAALTRLAGAQEKFYLQNNQYTTSLGDPGLNIGATSANDHYGLAITNADQNGFTARAQRPDSLRDTDETCYVYRINEQSRKEAEDKDGEDTTTICWR